MKARSLGRLSALLVTAWAASAAGADPAADAWYRAGREAVARARELTSSRDRARNVVLFVGDGMGLSTVTAARILEGQRRGESGEENLLAFERLPHLALSKTYNTDQQVPDSAGTMTAMVTGAKTRAGMLSVDSSVSRGDHTAVARHLLPTLFEQAEERGMATGLVTTTTVTHATPAACYAHVPERDWQDDSRLSAAARAADFPDIARQLVEFPHGDGLEVVLGGGRRHFLPAQLSDPEDPRDRGRRGDARDLTAEWLARHERAAYVWNAPQLEAVDLAATDHLLGLFAPSHLSFEADRAGDTAGEPSLSEMTAAALAILSRQPRGFALMVEGGRIDHGHHANSAYRALSDTLEFARAVETVLELTDPRETLVVVTADHGHVFTIAGYPKRGNDILGKVVPSWNPAGPGVPYSRDALGLPYTTLGYQNGPGYTGASNLQPEGPKHFPHIGANPEPIRAGRPDLGDTDTADPSYLQEATVPLRSETHSGEDVPIYAGGPGAALFHGVQEQSFVYHAIVEALGWNRRGAWESFLDLLGSGRSDAK